MRGWIDRDLDPHYRWPGNIRELEQCVWNVLIRNEYRPAEVGVEATDLVESMKRAMQDLNLTADQLLSRYCTLAYARTGSYEQAARRLALDRRTVKSRVDRELLERIKGSNGP